jgi:hypothetical protein
MCLYTPVSPCPQPQQDGALGFRVDMWHPLGGASSIDHHDCVFSEERHHVATAWVFIEFRTPGEGPQDHEILHHAAVLELVPNGLRVVWEGSSEVVCRWPRLMLVAARSNHDAPPARAACLLIVVVGCRCGPWGRCLRLFLPPLVPWMATSDGVSLLLLGVASLLPWVGQSLAASLLVAYGVVMLCISSVVYLKMLLCPPKHGFLVQHSSHVPHPLAILLVSLGFDALALLSQRGPG